MHPSHILLLLSLLALATLSITPSRSSSSSIVTVTLPARNLSDTSTSTQPHVVVVGGGIAGMLATRMLLKRGVRVTLLEARNHTGGRSSSVVAANGAVVDLGAQWLHGFAKHPFRKKLQALGVKTIQDPDIDAYIENGGKIWSNAFVNKLFAEWKPVTRLLEKYTDFGDYDRPLSFTVDRAYAQTGPHKVMTRAHYDLLVHSEIEEEYGGQVGQMSMWWWDDDAALSKGEHFVPSGVGAFVQRAFFTESVRNATRLNSPVTQIDASSVANRVRVTVGGTSENEVVEADAVIVTVPLGVLRSGSITFHPPLSTSFNRALSHRHPGTMEKIILIFATRFWPTPYTAYFSTNLTQPIAEFYDATFMNGGKPVLYAFLSLAQTAKYAGYSDDALVGEIIKELKRMWPDKHVPDTPLSYIAVRWVTREQYTLGAWSFNEVGIKPNVDFRALQQGPTNRIVFAGEHTSQYHFATMQGAFYEGVNAAATLSTRFGWKFCYQAANAQSCRAKAPTCAWNAQKKKCLETSSEFVLD